MKTELKTNLTAQEVMNKFYAKMEKLGNVSQEEVCNHIDDKSCYIVALGNFNYQVENGGIYQWLYNGYAFFGLGRIINILSKTIKFEKENKPSFTNDICNLIIKQLTKFERYEDPTDEEWEIDCYDCDGEGSFEDEYGEEEECCTCYGTGYIRTDNYAEVVKHLIENKFDEDFYEHDFIKVIEFINENFSEIMKSQVFY